jgi:hypothetical protein
MNRRPATSYEAGREPPPQTVLCGRRRFVARLLWVVLAALAMGLSVASIPATYARLVTLCEGAECDLLQLTLRDANFLEGFGLSVSFYAAYIIAFGVVFRIGFWWIGGILFWKRSDDSLLLYTSMALVTFGAVEPYTLRALADTYPLWDLPIAVLYFVGNTSFFVLLCVFPDGRFVPRWTRWTATIWVAYQLLYSFFPDLPFGPGKWPPLINDLLTIGLIASLALAQVYRYRRVSGPVERQQTKWVVLGFIAAITVFIGAVMASEILAIAWPGIPQVLYGLVGVPVIYLSALLIPLSMRLAIVRYRLYDIDIIIRRTLVYILLPLVLLGISRRILVYSPLTVVLTCIFAITDMLLQYLFFVLTGVEQSRVATVASTLSIAVLFQPLRQRIEGIVKQLVQDVFDPDTASESRR